LVIPQKTAKLAQITEEDYLKLTKQNKRLRLIKSVLESSLNHKTHGKMFSIVTGTWNPISGCLYDCRYCWAKNLALTKLKTTKRYADGFKPSLNISEFRVRFHKGDLIFVADMGDMFAPFIPDKWVKQVLDHIRQFPEADFLFMTKNPKRYLELLPFIPQNAILGATIETNIDSLITLEKVSVAPPPSNRAEAMAKLDWDRKIVSIEPILRFDLDTLVKWITDIDPFIVYVGYDNYCHQLQEPQLQTTLQLMQQLSENALVIKKTIRPAWSE
jgi:DNA repair photolyase